MNGLRRPGAWRRVISCTWRFAAVGPPLGTALIVIVPLAIDATEASDVIGGWLFFSIFSYGFAGPAALIAGLLYGMVREHGEHTSRWGLGALCGALGWLGQIAGEALIDADVQALNGVILLPLATVAGSVCARFIALPPSSRCASEPAGQPSSFTP
ncbi:hypothetical protein [Salinisphaera sp. Q1T1-3]|uniref:hypothetical protein n=1 Tax=Salinisphaera sp. Q1T1-3 TaxID=2321229 RepID=UPI000E7244BD|nr:hypothetical protein [Salinisphaera sp. Q1T1-3]RJS93598.1 hypothetical protein D3260_07930 [Salinisphaera sp. Q1T1-3]